LVEIRWLQVLSRCDGIAEIPELTAEQNAGLNEIVQNFSYQDAQRVKVIEQITNHDVKAVEYLLKEKVYETVVKHKRFVSIHKLYTHI